MQGIMLKLLIIAALFVASCAPHSTTNTSVSAASYSEEDLRQRSKDTIQKAQANLMKLQIDGKYWDMPSYLGIHYTSQYYLFLRWSGREKNSALDTKRLRKELLELQLKPGSWMAVRDHLQDKGDINATIMNYAALKAMGEPPSSPHMMAAKNWIVANGGIEKGSTFTKTFFAMFNQMSWNILPSIPLGLFDENLYVYPEKIFAQWITPHLYPMAYLKAMNVRKDLGSAFNLDELRATTSFKKEPIAQSPVSTPEGLKEHMTRMLRQQQPGGSFGAYTLATILSLMAIDNYKHHFPKEAGFISDSVVNKAMGFLDRMYVNNASNTYMGVVDDGHIWDTLLIIDALLESGMSKERLTKTAHYLASRQVENGGLPFGNDFDRYPDTDDTALVMPTFARYPELKRNLYNAGKFVVNMQNSDGGLGAFARNNYPIPLIDLFVGQLKDSADLYDESSADVIGHALEGIGRSYGPKAMDHGFISRSMEYLKKTRDPELKAWRGRWGVNYLYATSAVVTGMGAMGFPKDHEFIREGLQFLVSKQNEDGGFGETTASDLSKKYAGRGRSTPSQTALVLMAMLVDSNQYKSQISRAVQYLNEDFAKYGKWQDSSAVGTGHPVIIYMEYPSYPYAFPLKALGQFVNEARP